MEFHNLSTLITIRNFALDAYYSENVNVKLTPQDLKLLYEKIILLDKFIVKHLLTLELPKEEMQNKS